MIRHYTRKFNNIFVLFSGGKDSLVVLDLVARSIPKDKFVVLYTPIKGNTAPECTEYVKDICEQYDLNLLIAWLDKNLFVNFRQKGFPYITGMRWCAQRHKYDVWRQVAREYPKSLMITGVKRSDRQKRYELIKEYQYVDLWRSWAIAPIAEWSKKEICTYIEKRRLPQNPLYSKIKHSGNCLFCPFLNKEAFFRTMYNYWEISTQLFELLYEPPMSEKVEGKIKGCIVVYEKLLRWMSELDSQAQIEPLIPFSDDKCFEPRAFLLYDEIDSNKIILESFSTLFLG